MATKKATARKSTSGRVSSTKKPVATKQAAARVAAPVKRNTVQSLFPANLPNVILAEFVGTFFLTVTALFASSLTPLFVGFLLVVLVMALGNISGAHVNPAVTFGLFAMRKLKLVMVPVYWASQLLGALLAVGVMNMVTNGAFTVAFNHFSWLNVPLMTVEMIGMAAFMFGIAGVVMRNELSAGMRAFGIGLSLAVGVIVASSLLYQVRNADYEQYQKDSAAAMTEESADKKKASFPRSLEVSGAVLNPAVALGVTEDASTKAQITGEQAEDGAKAESRFGLDVILGTFIGAALGGYLYLLVSYRPKEA